MDERGLVPVLMRMRLVCFMKPERIVRRGGQAQGLRPSSHPPSVPTGCGAASGLLITRFGWQNPSGYWAASGLLISRFGCQISSGPMAGVATGCTVGADTSLLVETIILSLMTSRPP